MATISRMAINLAWEGQEAEAGLAKTSNLLKQTGIAALDAAQNFSQMIRSKVDQLGLDNSQIKSLSKLSELDQERALARMEDEQNLKSMSKSSQLLYEQMVAQAEEQAAADEKAKSTAKARAEMLSKLTILEKDLLFSKEKERALLMTMTPEQQKAYELSKTTVEKTKAEAEQRQKMLAGLSALDRKRLLEKEAQEKAIFGMTEKQQLAFEKSEKAKLEAQQRADRLSKMSFIERIKDMLKGMNDLKATIEMVRGVMNLAFAIPKAMFSGLSGLVKLGGELETMQIQMGALVGNFDAGASSLENLRQITRDMGVPLGELVGGFKDLVTAGLNAGDAEKLLRTFSKISPLLGQGGMGQVTSGIGSMAQSGMADRSALDAMQKGGIDVYQALGDKLSRITGEFHSARDAQKAVTDGAVLASTAIQAAQEAANSPKALAAAKRISESLEGQLVTLREGFTELLRDIGDGLLKGLNIKGFLASLKGVLETISLIVKDIVGSFFQIEGPGNGIEKNFTNARNATFDFIEALLDGADGMAKAFGGIDAIMQRVVARATWWKEFYKAESLTEVTIATQQYEGAMFMADLAEKNNKGFGKEAKDLIAKLRQQAKVLDEQRAKDIKPGAAADLVAKKKDEEIKLTNPAATDQFDSLRALQKRSLQPGALFNPGELQSALSGFLSKMNQPDAGINQRIEAGSAAAAEAIIRNNNREGVQNIQEQIKAAIEAATTEAERQTEIAKEQLKALQNIKLPATVQVGV